MKRLESRPNHRSSFALATVVAALFALSAPSSAHAQSLASPTPTHALRLDAFGALGYLASPGTNGAAFNTGLRLGVGAHLAFGLDLGYGFVIAPDAVQDRWWIMPSASYVISTGNVHFDFGAGIGLGATSGYTTWSAYVAAPFDPVWAFQLVPAARVHAGASIDVARNVDLFARVDVGAVLLDVGNVGFRQGSAQRGAEDTTWANLWVGFHYRLF